MTSPLTLAAWKTRTIMPQADVDSLDALEPGYIQACLDDWWDEIQARLRKRYDVAAMAVAPPRAVLRWLTKLVTKDVYDKRGYNPSEASDQAAIIGAAEKAEASIQEAANSQTGLYDLPLLSTSTTSGVSVGGPLAYTETSPYVWTDRQACRGRDEDRNG